MKKVLLYSALLLTAFSANSYAGEARVAHGVIHFTGSINRGPCEYSSTAWYRHAGRNDGISPAHAGKVPEPDNLCAGIADTSSISAHEVTNGSRATVLGKVVVVTFN